MVSVIVGLSLIVFVVVTVFPYSYVNEISIFILNDIILEETALDNIFRFMEILEEYNNTINDIVKKNNYSNPIHINNCSDSISASFYIWREKCTRASLKRKYR